MLIEGISAGRLDPATGKKVKNTEIYNKNKARNDARKVEKKAGEEAKQVDRVAAGLPIVDPKAPAVKSKQKPPKPSTTKGERTAVKLERRAEKRKEREIAYKMAEHMLAVERREKAVAQGKPIKLTKAEKAAKAAAEQAAAAPALSADSGASGSEEEETGSDDSDQEMLDAKEVQSDEEEEEDESDDDDFVGGLPEERSRAEAIKAPVRTNIVDEDTSDPDSDDDDDAAQKAQPSSSSTSDR